MIQEAFQGAKEIFLVVSHFFSLILIIRELKQPRRRPQRRLQKNNRFNDQNKSPARASRFLVHFFDVHRRVLRETSLFDVLWRTWTYDDEFSFLFLNLNKILKNSTPGKVACIWHIERVQIDAIKFERTQIHFFFFFYRRFHCRRRPYLRSLLTGDGRTGQLVNLSSDVFERHTSTGSGVFSFLDGGFAQIFGQIVSIIVKRLRNANLVASRCFKMKNSLLPVDVRRSKNVFACAPNFVPVRSNSPRRLCES